MTDCAVLAQLLRPVYDCSAATISRIAGSGSAPASSDSFVVAVRPFVGPRRVAMDGSARGRSLTAWPPPTLGAGPAASEICRMERANEPRLRAGRSPFGQTPPPTSIDTVPHSKRFGGGGRQVLAAAAERVEPPLTSSRQAGHGFHVRVHSSYGTVMLQCILPHHVSPFLAWVSEAAVCHGRCPKRAGSGTASHRSPALLENIECLVLCPAYSGPELSDTARFGPIGGPSLRRMARACTAPAITLSVLCKAVYGTPPQ